MLGVAGEDALADLALDALIGDGDEGPIGLALDVEVAAEVAHRDAVGDVAGLERELEPLLQLRLGDAGEGRGPGGSVCVERHQAAMCVMAR